MRVLMISLDKTLLGGDYSGDVIERHKRYGETAGSLEIIVFSKGQDKTASVLPRGLDKKRISSHLSVYSTNSTKKINYVFDAFNIAKSIYWPDKFDLVVAQDPFLTGLAGWLIKKRCEAPLLVHFHGDFWQNKCWLWEKWFNPFLLVLSKLLVGGADGVRVVSSIIKRKLVKSGIDKKKIKIIPTPVNVEKFVYCDPDQLRDLRKNIFEGRKTVINVGRDDLSKDYSTLIKTIELINDKYRSLAFCQIGADLQLEKKVKADENLILASYGKMSQEELANYYHAAHVYLSTSKHESFGKVLIEAMASGLPVVATATTGSKGIIRNGYNGYLVPIGDSQALARKVLYLLNNPQRAREIGQRGRKLVREKFGQEEKVKDIIGFWEYLSRQ